MKEWPNSFWAAVFMFMAAILAVVALYAPLRENVTMAVVTMASSIITGAFGYIQGVKDGSSHPPPPLDTPAEPATTPKA